MPLPPRPPEPDPYSKVVMLANGAQMPLRSAVEAICCLRHILDEQGWTLLAANDPKMLVRGPADSDCGPEPPEPLCRLRRRGQDVTRTAANGFGRHSGAAARPRSRRPVRRERGSCRGRVRPERHPTGNVFAEKDEGPPGFGLPVRQVQIPQGIPLETQEFGTVAQLKSARTARSRVAIPSARVTAIRTPTAG